MSVGGCVVVGATVVEGVVVVGALVGGSDGAEGRSGEAVLAS